MYVSFGLVSRLMYFGLIVTISARPMQASQHQYYPTAIARYFVLRVCGFPLLLQMWLNLLGFAAGVVEWFESEAYVIGGAS